MIQNEGVLEKRWRLTMDGQVVVKFGWQGPEERNIHNRERKTEREYVDVWIDTR